MKPCHKHFWYLHMKYLKQRDYGVCFNIYSISETSEENSMSLAGFPGKSRVLLKQFKVCKKEFCRLPLQNSEICGINELFLYEWVLNKQYCHMF